MKSRLCVCRAQFKTKNENKRNRMKKVTFGKLQKDAIVDNCHIDSDRIVYIMK